MSRIRLSKLMAQRGLCSRREADRCIEQGWVRVNGCLINQLGTRVEVDCEISLEPQARRIQAQRVTFLLNKPIGYVSGQPEGGYRSAQTLLVPERRYRGDRSGLRFHIGQLRKLAPAGRLDIDSQGLIVYTQDGRIARRLIGPETEIEKQYLVRVRGKTSPQRLAQLRSGLVLDGKPLKPARVSQINAEQLKITLTEGRKRQIRRMCEMVGLEVQGLKRVRIGRVRLGGLPEGGWRYLRADEMF